MLIRVIPLLCRTTGFFSPGLLAARRKDINASPITVSVASIHPFKEVVLKNPQGADDRHDSLVSPGSALRTSHDIIGGKTSMCRRSPRFNRPSTPLPKTPTAPATLIQLPRAKDRSEGNQTRLRPARPEHYNWI